MSLAISAVDMSTSADNSTVSSPYISRPSTPGTPADVLFNDATLHNEEYVLVTGGLGFIGSHTSVELLKSGYGVIIVDNLSNSFEDVHGRILTIADRHYEKLGRKRPSLEFHDMDYQDTEAMKAVLESHALPFVLDQPRRSNIVGVIHFAAWKAVEESIRQPLRYYRNNISGLIDFMAQLEEYNVKTFIFSSSATVYGTLADGSRLLREEYVVHNNETFTESDGSRQDAQPGCIGITSPYGRTKFFGEAILSDLAISDASWNIVGLRYFNPIGCDASGLLGEDPKGVPSNLFPVVIKVMTGQSQELSVYGRDWSTPDGTPVRDFIHVTDLARGHIAALASAQKGLISGGYRTFNLGTGTGYSVQEVVTAMETVSGRSIPAKSADRRPGDVQASVAATSRAATELGWKTQESLTDACRDICNYLTMRGL